jgi:hypothetical protein
MKAQRLKATRNSVIARFPGITQVGVQGCESDKMSPFSPPSLPA